MKTALHWALVLGALGFIAYKVPPLFEAARAETSHLGDLRWGWVALAPLLGLAAVSVYGELHRRLLRVGGVRVSAGTVQSITFAENAVAKTVPVVGNAGAIAYAISRFHRRGADTEVAAWAVLVAGTLATLSLVAMTGAALVAVGRLAVVWGGLLVVAAAAAGVGGWALVTRPAALERLVRPVLQVAERVPGRCPVCRPARLASLESRLDGVVKRLGLLRPSRREWLVLAVISALSYILDYAALASAAAGVVPAVPWAALVWGYLLVQGSIALQVLPGGAGLAAVGLLGALVGGGVPAAPAAGIVVIYRVCSWLLPAAVGWIVYAVQIHRIRPLPHVHVAAVPACL